MTEFWDRNQELFFIGPWCARHDRRADWAGLKHRFLPNPWQDAARFAKASDYCHAVSERLLVRLAAHLNSALGVSHNLEYWRLLLSPWLTLEIEQNYDHWVHVDDALTLHPELTTVVLDPAGDQTPRDILEFVWLSRSDYYHLQVFSRVLAYRRPGLPTRRGTPDATPYPWREQSAGKRFLKDALSWLLAHALPPGFGETLIAELNIHRAEQRALITGSRLKILPYLAALPDRLKPRPVRDERRLGLGRLEASDEFERYLIGRLPTDFPTLYLEGYHEARRFSLARLWRRPRVILSAIGWYYNEAFKFVVAECAEQGAELRGLQHGGVYGLWERAEGERYERGITGRYYGWGWAGQANDPKVRNLPHPLLSRIGPAEPGDKILLVSSLLPLHNSQLFRCIQGTLGFDYIERQARFAKALPDELRARFVVRLYPMDCGWRHDERLKELCPGIRFDDPAVPFTRSVATARLSVFDSPMTTWLEALAADVPVLLTWDPGVWPLRAEAQPYLEKLKRAGIFHETPEGAARQAAAIDADPRAWWDEPERRRAHREFTDAYAAGGKDWLAAWLKELA